MNQVNYVLNYTMKYSVNVRQKHLSEINSTSLTLVKSQVRQTNWTMYVSNVEQHSAVFFLSLITLISCTISKSARSVLGLS